MSKIEKYGSHVDSEGIDNLLRKGFHMYVVQALLIMLIRIAIIFTLAGSILLLVDAETAFSTFVTKCLILYAFIEFLTSALSIRDAKSVLPVFKLDR